MEGSVGIGNAAPGNQFGNANNLVIGANSGDNGITICAGTSSEGGLYFADGDSGADEYRGQIKYSHNLNNFVFAVNAAEVMRLNSTGLGIGTSSPAAKLHVAGNTYLNSGSNVWNLIGNNGIDFARETYFGYSSTYRILQLGTISGTNRSISIGVDVSSNSSGSFSGNEIIFPNQVELITPNAANNGYLALIATDSDNKVRIGNYRWNILNDTPGITIDTSVSTNHVGIGTIAPAQKLHVHGTATFGASATRLTTYSDSTYAGIFNGSTLSSDESIYFGSGHTYFINNGSASLTIDQTGKLGIFTTDPSYALDIGGTTASTGSTIRLSQDNGGTAIRVGSDGGDVTLVRVDGNVPNDGSSDSGEMGFSLKYMGSRDGNLNALSVFTDNQSAASQIEAVTIVQDGNVGIGTASPSTKLDIVSAPINAATLTTTTCKQLGLWINPAGTGSNTTGHIYNGIALSDGFAGLYGYDAGGSAATGLGFFTGNVSAVAERMRIDSSGNVGIGLSLIHI